MPGSERWLRATALAAIDTSGCAVVHVGGLTVAIFRREDQVFAVDNRCPHMGFPLAQGSLDGGILTCHWHHARFDVCTGGTFDPWADDVRAFPVEVRNGELWINFQPTHDPISHQLERLQVGLERDIPLVVAKAVLGMQDAGCDPVDAFRAGLDFGTRFRRDGWSMGLTTHVCLWNLRPFLDDDDRTRALFHGLSAVARDCAGEPPRFQQRPLPGRVHDLSTLKRWLRQFVEVRDAEGAERCVVTAVQSGLDQQALADLLFAAATDHRFIDIGHPLDFTNKAFESLDATGWNKAEAVLGSLIGRFAAADRMEESNAWRHPIDLVQLAEEANEELPALVEAGRARGFPTPLNASLPSTLLTDDPRVIQEALLSALREGCSPVELAGAVAQAAARRIAQFPASNDFSDWDTALHTFTFANAVQQGLRRITSWELVRGVFDAAMSVYLDRFLNVPAVPLPKFSPNAEGSSNRVAVREDLLQELSASLDRRHDVDAAAALVTNYLSCGGDPQRLLATLGKLLLREDRDFHSIQMVEAAFRQYSGLAGTSDGAYVLVAAIRYLAAHSPTRRVQGQVWRTASRLHRNENVFE